MKVDSESNRSVNRIATIAGSSESFSAPRISSARNDDEKSGALTQPVRRLGVAQRPGQHGDRENRRQERQRVVPPHQHRGDQDPDRAGTTTR